MPRSLHFPKTYGVRLNADDAAKLQHLAAHLQRPPSELMRLLIRRAQPVDVAPITFVALDDGHSLVKEEGAAD